MDALYTFFASPPRAHALPSHHSVIRVAHVCQSEKETAKKHGDPGPNKSVIPLKQFSGYKAEVAWEHRKGVLRKMKPDQKINDTISPRLLL